MGVFGVLKVSFAHVWFERTVTSAAAASGQVNRMFMGRTPREGKRRADCAIDRPTFGRCSRVEHSCSERLTNPGSTRAVNSTPLMHTYAVTMPRPFRAGR